MMRRGDVITLGRHRLMCGDATSPDDVAQLFGDRSAHLVITSPPYLAQRTYQPGIIGDWDELMRGAFGAIPVADDCQVLVNLGLVHRKKEWVPYWDDWIEWMRAQGWLRFAWYVWDQGAGMPGDPAKGRLWSAHEFVFHFTRQNVAPTKTQPTINAGKVRRGAGQRRANGTPRPKHTPGTTDDRKPLDSVLRIPRYGQSDGHPAPFPSGLPEALMTSWPLGLVYDPFGGSGTTLLAAQKVGLPCVMMEIVPEYCEIVVRRFRKEFPLFITK
jgi:DNA modification methylase